VTNWTRRLVNNGSAMIKNAGTRFCAIVG
jgi:hypothetical protein